MRSESSRILLSLSLSGAGVTGLLVFSEMETICDIIVGSEDPNSGVCEDTLPTIS